MRRANRTEILQGTLDLIILRALATMGPQHAYGLVSRLEQVADYINAAAGRFRRSTHRRCARR